jgi:aminopeptidase N
MENRFALSSRFMVYLREDWLLSQGARSSRSTIVFQMSFDRHAYEKGACVVSMLRHELGDEPFFPSASHYLNKFANGVAPDG